MDTDPAEATLRRSWSQDMSLLAADAGPEAWRAEADLLVARWTEPHRHYHTLQHLAEVMAALAELTAAGELSQDEARVARVAGWYHDLAYDTRARAGSNEHRSATLARDHLHRLGVDTAVVDAVERAVLLTLDHEGARADEPVLAAFHDADLWILSAPPDRFDSYCAQVRREYGHVPGPLYAEERARILGRLTSGRVYRTPAAQAWHERAVANVGRELTRLTA